MCQLSVYLSVAISGLDTRIGVEEENLHFEINWSLLSQNKINYLEQ